MANPFTKDDWDWPFILYAGRVWLNYTDKETMSLTPLQLFSQLKVHRDVIRTQNGEKPVSEEAGYIDKVPGW